MKIKFWDANKVLHEGKIIAVFHENNNHYIAYTPQSSTHTKIDILVGKYEPKDDNTIRIYDIASQEEWQFITKVLMNKIKRGEINA